VKKTLLDAFGFAGTTIDAYPANSRPDINEYGNAADTLVVGDLLTTYYDGTAAEVSANVDAHASGFLGCAVPALGTGTCLQDFLTKYGQKLWRRPLTAEEIAEYQRLYTTTAASSGPDVGFSMVVEALILSPNFVFRTELGSSQASGSGLRDRKGTLGAALAPASASCGAGPNVPFSADVPMEAAAMATMVGTPTLSRLFLDVMAFAMSCGMNRIASMMWGAAAETIRIFRFSMSSTGTARLI
jgi:hypothetical protein